MINFNGIRANGSCWICQGLLDAGGLPGGFIVSGILFVIEFLGVFIRSTVLAIRLFAQYVRRARGPGCFA